VLNSVEEQSLIAIMISTNPVVAPGEGKKRDPGNEVGSVLLDMKLHSTMPDYRNTVIQ